MPRTNITDMTITNVAANFQLVCTFANKKQKKELAELVKQIKTVNFVYGLETPIERLAFTGDDEAVRFLLRKFDGSLDYAVRGYARANRTNGPITVEGLIRSGANIDYAVTGYAIADNTAAVEDLLRRGAEKGCATKGYAQAGNEDKVLALLLPPGSSNTSDINRSNYLRDASLGFASGNHVVAVNNLWSRLSAAANRYIIQPVITEGYAWANNQVEVNNWKNRNGNFSYSALCGYANGGHINEFKTLATQIGTAGIRENMLGSPLRNLSFAGHIVQARELFKICITPTQPAIDIIHIIFVGYEMAGNLKEMIRLCQKHDLHIYNIFKTYANSLNFPMIELLYNKYKCPNVLESVETAVTPQLAYIASLRSEQTSLALAKVTSDEFRKILIDCMYKGAEDLYDKTKKISDKLQQGLSYDETKNKQLIHLMDDYHFSDAQARLCAATGINAGILSAETCFVFFMQIAPALTNKFKEEGLTWMIASFLLPLASWGFEQLRDNKRLYSQCNLVSAKDMSDITNKMSAVHRLGISSTMNRNVNNTLHTVSSSNSTSYSSSSSNSSKKRKRSEQIELIDATGAEQLPAEDKTSQSALRTRSIFAQNDNHTIEQSKDPKTIPRFNP